MPKAIVGTGGSSGIPEFAGSTWVRLQYVLGLQQLGFDVYWLDRLSAVDPRRDAHSAAYLAERFHDLAVAFGFEDRYCLIYDGGARYYGLGEEDLRSLAQSAAVYVGIGGQPSPETFLMTIPRRAYIDVDPGFTQIWALTNDLGFDRYTHFFTVGQNVGRTGFGVPTNGISWRTMLPPVVLEHWPAMIDASCSRFTTVADWRGSQDAIFGDTYYGGKRSEFVRFIDVPMLSGQGIELALTIGQQDFEDIGLLDGHGWRMRDPYRYAGDPVSYREFIQYSRAEFSVAKAGYLRTNSGWISDRTACYLASGKPACVQSTGFEWKIPTGAGLLTFTTLEEAVSAVRDINDRYAEHAVAARRIAEDHFDSKKVLADLLVQMAV